MFNSRIIIGKSYKFLWFLDFENQFWENGVFENETKLRSVDFDFKVPKSIDELLILD